MTKMSEIETYALNRMDVRVLRLLCRLTGLEVEIGDGKVAGIAKSPAMGLAGDERR